jgi:hypothetical protein
MNTIHYDLDVLAGSPAEINQIAERLNHPSSELANWVAQSKLANLIAQREGRPVSEVAEILKELLEFKTVENLGDVAPDGNKARRFGLSISAIYDGIGTNHLFEVSKAFPNAIFLLQYSDVMTNYAGQVVIRAGDVVQEVDDSDQPVQDQSYWTLLDIFAPFRTEYFGEEHEFGSLWTPWLDAIMTRAKLLKDKQTSAHTGSPDDSVQHEQGEPS